MLNIYLLLATFACGFSHYNGIVRSQGFLLLNNQKQSLYNAVLTETINCTWSDVFCVLVFSHSLLKARQNKHYFVVLQILSSFVSLPLQIVIGQHGSPEFTNWTYSVPSRYLPTSLIKKFPFLINLSLNLTFKKYCQKLILCFVLRVSISF